MYSEFCSASHASVGRERMNARDKPKLHDNAGLIIFGSLSLSPFVCVCVCV